MSKIRLGDVCKKIGSGFTPRGGKSVYKSSGIALIRSQNVLDISMDKTGLAYISNEQAKIMNGVIVQKDDVLLNITGDSVARVSLVNEEFLPARVNQHVAIIRVDKNIILPSYLQYFLHTQKKYLLQIAASNSTRNALTKEIISELEIKLPSLKTQTNVALVLDLIQCKIKSNKSINDNLEKQLRTIYDYWFTQFDFPDEKGKPYRFSGGKMVWNEELKRESPEGWCVKKLSEILNVITGKEDANFSSLNGQYKFFTCSNTTLLCDEFAFDGKAVLIAGNGDFNVKHYSGKFNAYQRTYVLLPKEVLLRAQIYLVAKQMINRFVNGSNGSIVKFITKGDIENITIFIPHDLQLYKLLNDLLDAIEVNQQEIDQLIKLRDWLLPMLMNGQATVVN